MQNYEYRFPVRPGWENHGEGINPFVGPDNFIEAWKMAHRQFGPGGKLLLVVPPPEELPEKSSVVIEESGLCYVGRIFDPIQRFRDEK